MSCPTENTIVLPTKSEATFLQQAAQHRDTYHLRGLARIHADPQIVIYLFDSNGDNPWMHEPLVLPWLILEINYLDGEGPYTMLPDGDSPQPCLQLLAQYLSPCLLREVGERMAYSH